MRPAVERCDRHPGALQDDTWGCRECFFDDYPTQRDFDQRNDPRV